MGQSPSSWLSVVYRAIQNCHLWFYKNLVTIIEKENMAFTPHETFCSCTVCTRQQSHATFHNCTSSFNKKGSWLHIVMQYMLNLNVKFIEIWRQVWAIETWRFLGGETGSSFLATERVCPQTMPLKDFLNTSISKNHFIFCRKNILVSYVIAGFVKD